MRLKVVILLALKSLFVLVLYSSSYLIAMDDKKDLEVRLLPAQSNEIESAIDSELATISNNLKDALPQGFPTPLLSLVFQYSTKQKKDVCDEVSLRLINRQNATDSIVLQHDGDNQRPFTKSLCASVGGFLFWLTAACTIYLLVSLPKNPCHNSIAQDASWNNTCWQQRNLACCYNYMNSHGGALMGPVHAEVYGDHTIFPDSQPGNQEDLPLGQAVSQLVQNGPCVFAEDRGVCPQLVDCSEVDRKSPNYYKNFNPCKGLIPIPNMIKPSPLTRKIAMARDKQLKNKQRKNNITLAK